MLEQNKGDGLYAKRTIRTERHNPGKRRNVMADYRSRLCTMSKNDIENPSIYQFIQINKLGNQYGVVTGLIDLTAYSNEELQKILAAYDWTRKEAKEWIAEAVFETECLEYDHIYYDNWNEAIQCVEIHFSPDGVPFLFKKILLLARKQGNNLDNERSKCDDAQ